MSLYVQEAWVNATERLRAGESEVYESGYASPGDLFRAAVRAHGRCVGKVYIGDGIPVGWCFVKCARYEDTGETYLLETWITLHDAPDTVTRERHYHRLDGAS